jgi:hypothetical protein
MKAASPVTVDLYRLAYNAGRPVTFKELVDGMPSAYQNDANRWYVDKMRAERIELRPDPWPADMLRSVMEMWVREEVRTMCNTRRFSVAHRDGGSAKGKPFTELVYEVRKEKASNGQGGPPMVWEEYLDRRLVPWTPEIGATGRRHVAGIKFRDEMTRVRALGPKATKHDLEEALELAAEALSFGPQP